MAAWPEAVWIVKKLQDNFDFSSQLNNYTNNLNQINGRVNNLIDNIQDIEDDLNNKYISIIAAKEDDNPSGIDDSTTFSKGVIWLITQ